MDMENCNSCTRQCIPVDLLTVATVQFIELVSGRNRDGDDLCLNATLFLPILRAHEIAAHAKQSGVGHM